MGSIANESIPWRVFRLETTVDKHDDAIGKLQESDATFTEQISGLKDSNIALKTSMDRVFVVLVTLCITIIGATVTALLTLA